jgi:hypothetical protein
MSEPVGGVYLSPEAEAERLWGRAQEAFEKAKQSITDLCEAVDLGARVVEILTVHCLRRVRGEFPTTVAGLLEPPPPEVDAERDFLHPPRSLRFVDALDMLSAPALPCISQDLHRGWEDRVSSCRRSRARAERATGISLEEREREALVLIGAYRNRIFLLPPPVRVVPEEVLGAFPAVVALVERLFASVKAPAS